MAENVNDLKTPKFKIFRNTIPAFGTKRIDGSGSFFYVKESTGPILVQMDDGQFLPWDVGTGPDSKSTGMFRTLTVQNPFSYDIIVELYVGVGSVYDNRLTIVPTRNSTLPVTETSNNFDSSPLIVCDGTAQLLLPLNASRGEVWLWTDEPAGIAYWAESAARLAAPKPFQKIGLTIDGFTRLKTRAAIYVKAAIGVNIGAITFNS